MYTVENWGKNFWAWYIFVTSLYLVFTGLFYKLEAKFVNYIRVKFFSPEYVKKYSESLKTNELVK
jgi:hypothetical protein